jgi:hypothetical protein
VLQKDLCLVKSLWEYIQLQGVDKVNTGKPQPLFSLMDNSPLSLHNNFNCLWNIYIGLSWRNYKTHSVRIGTVTTASAMGISEEKIQQMGRWHSKVFKNTFVSPHWKFEDIGTRVPPCFQYSTCKPVCHNWAVIWRQGLLLRSLLQMLLSDMGTRISVAHRC